MMELDEKYKASQISLYILIWTIYKIYLSKQLLIKFVWIMELGEKYKASQISLNILNNLEIYICQNNHW